ncbi:hypothetical protein [Flagellimonas sp. CMM7]|uniref:hypothetical protein n=1 Tax=Flagellimonas sp. CMM7 TaxID=2654676 RepID=UPI0013D39836|nr:hypothetical protein [Flagellimonas sp. CMM7]UII80032.1 hypothetical protein LV704_00575 [Flagellimonas sp. CMM7]
METPFNILCKIEKYKDAIPQLERQMQYYLSKGHLGNYWEIKGMISAYKKVIEDFKEFENVHFPKKEC